jgi:hypothetical protein
MWCAPKREDSIGELLLEKVEVVDGKQPVDVTKALEHDARCSLVKLKQNSSPPGKRNDLSTKDPGDDFTSETCDFILEEASRSLQLPRRRILLQDEGPDPASTRDESLLLKPPERLTDHRPRNTEVVREFRLRRKP